MIESTSSPTKKSHASDCCGDSQCGPGLRNNYFEGKRLTPDSFRVEQDYGLQRRHLLNRAIHGWGVVYGYAIKAVPSTKTQDAASELRLGPGLALDQCGRELLETAETPLSIADVIVLDTKGFPVADPQTALSATPETCWLLSAHYAEYDLDPVSVQDPCQCVQRHWDRVCETVRYSLRPIACEQYCAEPVCGLDCECAAGGCCGSHTPDTLPPSAHRGGCRCLCDHLTNLQFPECGRLSAIEGPCCKTSRVAVRDGVPLACLKLTLDSGKWTFTMEVEDCGPRRLVKRNDLLFDLIRGCDLTRISEIGWHNWHRNETPVPFNDFSAALGPQGLRKKEYITELFWVKFSRPVRKATLLRDCIAMTILSHENKDGWLEPLRVPIVRLETAQYATSDPDHVTGFQVVVNGAWLEDAVRGRETIFHDHTTWVEIELHGDLIVDCNGQPVDANGAGLIPAPTGNGAPGGTFLSSFAVEKPAEIAEPIK